jgi:exodeoxyribonuclease VII small subunit
MTITEEPPVLHLCFRRDAAQFVDPMGKPADKAEVEQLELPFEQAIERIEEIVARMEGERLPLEELIRQYDEGTCLLEVCRRRIDEAQRKIELITRRSDGTLTAEPFHDEEPPTAEQGSARTRQRV